MHDERSLLALQGPAAVKAVQALCKDDLSSLYFSHFRRAELGDVPVWLTRTGYTGEDGFEISVPNGRAAELAQALLDKPGMRLCGETPLSIRAPYRPLPIKDPPSDLIRPFPLSFHLLLSLPWWWPPLSRYPFPPFRPGGPRQPAAGGRLVPVRQRPHRGHQPRRGGPGMVHRQEEARGL